MKRRESIRHRSWTCSEGFRVNVARAAPVLLAFVVQPGPLIFTRGAVVSTVKLREVASVPCSAVNVWLPSESVELVNGEVQSASTTTLSIRQLTLVLESGEEKAKLGVGSLVGEPEAGPEVITRPILQVLAAEPTFPASSVALTWKLCCPVASWLAA